ncbi:MAG: isoleucine--tRNA ligase [Deltaproteobacteria bacterium]|nr:isoleucine--tRNA ligase [Deltaproteobacteria bacterium]
MDYKDTLNLPKTGFPMKANLAKKEPEQLTAWENERLYEKIRETSKSFTPFILHDGPPYANGNIHIGTALNKILKDIIIRSKQMSGFNSPYVPGWDCHGLPIEHNVDKELKEKKEVLGQVDIRKRCRKYANRFVDIQKEQFKRLGIMGEWDDPYLTMNYKYEAVIARKLGEFALEGSLFRNKKPIHWCCSCKTALAEAEIEYNDETSDSIFVKFLLKDDISGLIADSSDKKIYIVIWTTTPWTIPANLAVALHPSFIYSAIDIGGGEILILAKDLVEDCMKKFGVKDYSIKAEITAAELENKRCAHPLYKRDSVVILGDHVTLEAGTGAVHTACGHGREDYEIGLKYGLEPYSPVDDNGRFTNEAEMFENLFVFDANKKIIEKLKESGALIGSEKIEHSYPHCWRCKKPVIFRSTPQWFISMDKQELRKKSLDQIEKVKWIPNWGKERIYSMIENRPDWCVSRQRVWGVPIIVFYCDKCNAIHIDSDSINSVCARFEEKGADVWFEAEAADIINKGAKCAKCGNGTFTKETDILDVWFDSGVSHFAVLEEREHLKWPADLYLEGSDQHRGWFHSSLLTSVGLKGEAPYKSVLTHGFVVDAKGRKMSKSVGNVILPSEVIDKYGAEILRLWASASDYRDDIRISDAILKQLTDAYRRIRNTCRFILGNLKDFDPKTDGVSYDNLEDIDKFALHKAALLTKRITEAYDSYEFHTMYHFLHNYCSVDLSAFYLDILKDRLYVYLQNSKTRRSAQTVLYKIIKTIAKLMAPVLPFTAEEVWKFTPDYEGKEESVHLELFPKYSENMLNDELAEKWGIILELRKEVTKALETARAKKVIGHSLDAEVKIFADDRIYKILLPYGKDLRSIFIVSKAEAEQASEDNKGDFISSEIEGLSISVKASDAEKCQRCWVRDPSVGEEAICLRCRQILNSDA